MKTQKSPFQHWCSYCVMFSSNYSAYYIVLHVTNCVVNVQKRNSAPPNPQNQSDNMALCSFLFLRFKYNDRVYLRRKEIQTLFLYGGQEREKKKRWPLSKPHRGGRETLVKVLAAVLLPQKKRKHVLHKCPEMSLNTHHIRERQKYAQ